MIVFGQLKYTLKLDGDLAFLHAKPWIPLGGISIFTGVIERMEKHPIAVVVQGPEHQ